MRSFLETEASGGIILMAAAVAALVIANSPLAPAYFGILKTYVGGLSLLHWVNDALMAVFFLVVGLEIKREVLDGQLSTWDRRVLPGLAAAGGVAVPALIYAFLNWDDPGRLGGWAIPAATDIAFALGVIALLGSRVPASLKIFLTAVAIIDDLMAVLIIALFYSAGLAILPLAAAAVSLLVLIGLNRLGVTRLTPYVLIGAVTWYCVLLSGVHATIAGVAVALTIPLHPAPARPDDTGSPLHRLEHALHPWVAYVIVPLFGFANAGVSFAGMALSDAVAPVPLGVALGLFIGKQIGISVTVWAVVRLGFGELPARASWPQFYGVSLLCGIGFTMSLFIGALAFGEGSALNDAAKIGVLMGSVVSGLLGWLVLRLSKPARGQPEA
jgi:NhaA family Na+:H+ antiporter